MKKLLKLSCLIVIGISTMYSYKTWFNDSDNASFKMENIELKQSQLDISPINIDANEAIWSVKSNSKLVCFSMVFKNEGDRSFGDNPAILDVVIKTIFDGAGKLDAIALKKAMADNSINISISSNQDSTIVDCSCLQKHFDLAIDLIHDMLTKAHLKSEKIEIAKQAINVSLQQGMFSPSFVAGEKLNNLMYQKGHPYRYSIKETSTRLKEYTKKDIDDCYKKLFSPSDVVVTIVSPLNQDQIKEKFNKLIISLKKLKSNNFKNGIQKTDLYKKDISEHFELDNPQSSVLFALPGVSKNSGDRFAASLANDVFGEVGLLSRLSKSVRDIDGLVYRISTSSNFDSDLQSYIIGTADTRPENVKNVILKVKEECRNLYEKGITEKELSLFKVRKFAKNIFDSNNSILNFVQFLRLNNSKLEDINSFLDNYKKLKLTEVNKVIKKVFNPDNLIFVDCGKSVKTKEIVK